MRRLSCRTALAGVALVYAVAFVPAPATAAPGDLDPSFGDAGQTSFRLSFHERVQEGEPATVAFPGDGDIELMGTATPPPGSAWRMFAARLQEDGALDPAFGSGGTVITRLPPEAEETHTIPVQSIFAGALEADGAMVGVGPRVEGRLSAAGAFDPSFRNQLQMNAFAVVGLPDGQMLAAGETPTEGEVARYPTLERLLADGAPDLSFGTEGLVRLPDRAGPTARESAHSILLLPDGELLLAGIGEVPGEQFGWLAEVTATGSLDRSFGDEGVDYVPAKTPARLVSEHVTCGRVRLGRHRGAERCTLELRHLRGTWKSARSCSWTVAGTASRSGGSSVCGCPSPSSSTCRRAATRRGGPSSSATAAESLAAAPSSSAERARFGTRCRSS